MPSKNVRSRWITVILYPENSYHMEFLEYLKEHDYNLAYIMHDMDVDENGNKKKPHYHVLIHFDSQRSAQSVVSAAGKGWFKSTDDGYVCCCRNDDGAQEKEILSYPHTCDICRDAGDYLHYMIHDTFNSRDKVKYSYYDIHFCGVEGDIEKYFKSKARGKADDIETLVCYFDKYGSCQNVLSAVLQDKRYDLIPFLTKHSYFIKTFMERERG